MLPVQTRSSASRYGRKTSSGVPELVVPTATQSFVVQVEDAYAPEDLVADQAPALLLRVPAVAAERAEDRDVSVADLRQLVQQRRQELVARDTDG